MKKFLSSLTLGLGLLLCGAVAMAADAVVPVPNKGDTAFMTIATVLVILMTIPGLALFYGGLVRSKNMLSVLMQVFVVSSLIYVLWVIYGYSVAFTGGSPFFGGFDKLFFQGITPDSVGATFSKGVVIPEFTFAAFQATFAAITCALIVGAFAERVRFSAVLLFSAIWFTFSYLPVAHMVWYWDGPDAITDAATLETVTAAAGWLWAKGALDFAGGTVVHINAAVAGLVGAYVIGKRTGYGKESMAPHSMVLCMVGTGMLWVGWYGFNAGSALEANGFAALASSTCPTTRSARPTGCARSPASPTACSHPPDGARRSKARTGKPSPPCPGSLRHRPAPTTGCSAACSVSARSLAWSRDGWRWWTRRRRCSIL